jgi:15-cis-phytoene synthase
MTPALDPDRLLALSYVPAARRQALEALWRLDVTFGTILVTGTQAMVSRIRMAWWREALERLDAQGAPAEPMLQSLAAHVLPTVSGAELAAMEAGWAELLSEEPLDGAALAGYAEGRGATLFRLSARLLGVPDFPVEGAGRRWALADLARRSGTAAEAAAAAAAAPGGDDRPWPSQLRPLGMLSVLTRRDLARPIGTWERQGSPARMLLMLKHRFTGR